MDLSNHKLRVAHIITQLELGGAQQNTLYTVSHLNAEKYEPILICGKGGILDEEAKQGAWPPHFVKLIRPLHPVKDIFATIEIYKFLRQIKPHIVHTHSSKAGILGRIAAYLAGAPVIVHTFHGFGFNSRQKPWTRWLFIKLEILCAHLSTHLVFVSKDNEEEALALRITGKKPYCLIRSGIYMGEDRRKPNKQKICKELGIPEDAWVVVSTGNFKPQKNPLDLVLVAEKVLQNKPASHFIFLGDGELREKCEALAKDLNISDQLHFLGWCTNKSTYRVSDILAISKCFLLTSLWEGLPRALVEAMIARLPAIANSVDGVKDILLDGINGYLIPPRDVDLAAEKIIWLADHPLDAVSMGIKGHESVSDEFDIDKMVRQQEELYTQLYANVPLKEYYEPQWSPETSSSTGSGGGSIDSPPTTAGNDGR